MTNDQITLSGHLINRKGGGALAKQTRRPGAQTKNTSKKEERAHRILDAAAALILRWGYDKTTIEDIAKQASVAKGTIYLHWKTREELIMALMTRENLKMVEDIKLRVTEDPAGFILRGMFKHSALALMKRPLLKAFLLRDLEVVGKLVHGEHSSAAFVEKVAGFNAYLEFMREHDLVRKDLDPRGQVYMLSAIFMGFLLMAPLMPDGFTLSDEEIADLMAETVHRTFESDRSVSADELRSVSRTCAQYLDRALKLKAEQFQQALDPGHPSE